MCLSELTIENPRCFGSGKNKFEMTLKSDLTTLLAENDTGNNPLSMPYDLFMAPPTGNGVVTALIVPLMTFLLQIPGAGLV